ncbi:MAG: transglycosylase domain-containing protein [Saprospiraceae bacterium]|nr:transglycosylase domain-containing protein [Saprospiraceae bacterium]
MRNLFQSLLQHPTVQKIRQRIVLLWAPVQMFWNRATAPVRQFFSPLTQRWLRLTYPLRVRWAAFRQKSPVLGGILNWTGRLFKWGFIALLLLVFSVWIGAFGKLPSFDELRSIETANTSEVYAADNDREPIGKFYIENRTTIPLDSISPFVVKALIATEDRRFFTHSGVDLQSWFRVAYGMATRKSSLGGGSTLSQQLAKNLYPRKSYGMGPLNIIINKIRENFISIKLERIYSKPELLNLYLNTVPFGGDRFGINVASKYFFNRKPKDLSPDQAATLIGMLQASTKYDPTRNPELSRERRNLVLRQMVRNGDLSEADFQTLSKKPVGAKRYGAFGNNDGLATYFREYLRTSAMPRLLKNLKKEDGSDYNLYTDGLKIYTTLNSQMQRYAEEAVAKHMATLQQQFDKHWKNYKNGKPWGDDKWIDEQLRRSDRWGNLSDAGMSEAQILENFQQPVKMTVFTWKNGGSESDTTMTPLDSVRYYFCLLNCGFMAMDHRTGYVQAWVGGTNFKHFKFDHNLSRRQVGSTFKPIVYAAAVQDSVKPCQFFPNQLVKLEDWEPHNADERYGGYYTMAGALQKSVNVVAAQLIERVGIQKTIDLATKMGVTAKLPREFGISLGAADISLIDMMKVYGTLANGGVRPDPVVVLKITDRKGNVLYDYEEELKKDPKINLHERALTTDQAAIMTRMLQQVINYGTGARLRSGYGIQGDFAGKTGTTQNHSDGWFICYNPDLVTGAWVGGESPAVRFRDMSLGQGSAMALPIVAWFWHKVANDRKYGKILHDKFPEPSPAIAGMFGCPTWIGISPDTFNILMQDSTIADTLRARGYKDVQDVLDSYFGTQEPPGGEGGDIPDEGEGEQQGEDRRERRKDFFDKLLGREKEDKDKKKGGGGNRR